MARKPATETSNEETATTAQETTATETPRQRARAPKIGASDLELRLWRTGVLTQESSNFRDVIVSEVRENGVEGAANSLSVPVAAFRRIVKQLGVTVKKKTTYEVA